MDKLEKLLSKAGRKDREKILAILNKLRSGELAKIKYQKLKQSSYYKIRVGKYRVIFSFNSKQKIRIKAVRLKNEKTYK